MIAEQQVHTLIIGGGPGGLACAVRLAEAGLGPVVVEAGAAPGGLMRSVHRGEFTVDLGRKELYSRINEVDIFWSELLGSDYRIYPHRVGILYKKKIFEISPKYRGLTLGIPWKLFLECGLDVLSYTREHKDCACTNYEEYRYATYGRLFSQVLFQGFDEKFTGKKWAEIDITNNFEALHPVGLAPAISRKLVDRLFRELSPPVWRHPAKGTGQICERLAERILGSGGRICLQTRVTGFSISDNKILAVFANCRE